jgi:hypothetical protein
MAVSSVGDEALPDFPYRQTNDDDFSGYLKALLLQASHSGPPIYGWEGLDKRQADIIVNVVRPSIRDLPLTNAERGSPLKENPTSGPGLCTDHLSGGPNPPA